MPLKPYDFGGDFLSLQEECSNDQENYFSKHFAIADALHGGSGHK